MQFKTLLLEVGPIPPAGGPARDHYLRTRGTESLAGFKADFSEALSRLGVVGEALPPTTLRRVGGEVRFDGAGVEPWKRFRSGIEPSRLADARPFAVRAERRAVEALNCLEDHPERDDVHRAVHLAGSLRGGLYGCALAEKEGLTWIACQCRLAHLRFGTSVGMTASFECSICGEAPEDCVHIPGEMYEVEVVRADDGSCNVCADELCTHLPGEIALKEMVSRARDAIGHEVSVVRRPRYPTARFAEVGFEIPKDAEAADATASLRCTACVEACPGLFEMPDDPGEMVARVMWYGEGPVPY